MRSKKEIWADIKVDQKKKGMLFAPILILVPAIIFGIPEEDVSQKGSKQGFVNVEQDSISEYSSKKEAYTENDNKISKIKSEQKKASNTKDWFGSFDNDELGYLEENTVVEEQTSDSVVNSSAPIKPLEDFVKSHSTEVEHKSQAQTTHQTNGSSTVVLYSDNQSQYTPYEQPKQTTTTTAPVVQETQFSTSISGSMLNGSDNSSVATTFINAIIHNKGNNVASGSSVQLRIKEDCHLGNYFIPKNTMVTAIASLAKERVYLKVSSIIMGTTIIPVSMEVYEMDGQRGIYSQDLLGYEISNDVADEGIDQAKTTISVGSLGSISTNALKRKKDFKEVPIPEGHQIILKEY